MAGKFHPPNTELDSHIRGRKQNMLITSFGRNLCCQNWQVNILHQRGVTPVNWTETDGHMLTLLPLYCSYKSEMKCLWRLCVIITAGIIMASMSAPGWKQVRVATRKYKVARIMKRSELFGKLNLVNTMMNPLCRS
jgi:hypothetical protein